MQSSMVSKGKEDWRRSPRAIRNTGCINWRGRAMFTSISSGRLKPNKLQFLVISTIGTVTSITPKK